MNKGVTKEHRGWFANLAQKNTEATYVDGLGS